MEKLRNLISRNVPRSLLFFLLLIFIACLYDYPDIFTSKPEGAHLWRQTDSASQAMNFYDSSLNLFQPRVHNLLDSDGRTAGEFPILYYIAGLLYRIFGPHDIILRLLNLFLVFMGLWALHQMVFKITADAFWAMTVPVFIFVSPVMLYYSAVFIPDPPALGLTLLGWYFFFRFSREGTYRLFLWAILMMLLACLIKLSMAISLVAILCAWLIERLKLIRFSERGSVFHPAPWRFMVPVLSSFVLLAAWSVYAKSYSLNHGGILFLGNINPITKATPTELWEFPRKLRRYLMPAFYWKELYYLFPVLLLYPIIRNWRKLNLLLLLTALLLMGAVLFCLLFFRQFIFHDYYLICLLIVPAFLILANLAVLKEQKMKKWVEWVLKGLFLVALIVNGIHASVEMRNRIGGRYSVASFSALYEDEFKTYLDGIGLTEDKAVLVIPDYAPNQSLYLLGRKGWTSYNLWDYHKPRLLDARNLGIDYVIVLDTCETFYNNLVFPTQVGEYEEVQIFKLEWE